MADDLYNESGNVSGISAVSTSYLSSIYGFFLSVLIMCGNLLVIISIIYFKQLHTPTNYLILSLAVADLLVGVLVLHFSTILAVCSHCFLANLLCEIRGAFNMILCTSSILNLSCISIDRYYAVCQPLRYTTKINVRVTVVMLTVIWTVSVLIGIGNTILELNREKLVECFEFQKNQKRKPQVLMGIFLSFYLPAVVMIAIYLKILMVAQRQERSIQNTTCQSTKSGATVSKKERKATKTLAIVMGLFVMCWTPFFLCITLQNVGDYTVPLPVYEMFAWLGWSNSMLNPFIYGFFYTWFRLTSRMIISGKIFQGDFTHHKLF